MTNPSKIKSCYIYELLAPPVDPCQYAVTNAEPLSSKPSFASEFEYLVGDIRRDICIIALTRPQMFAGVTYTFS